MIRVIFSSLIHWSVCASLSRQRAGTYIITSAPAPTPLPIPPPVPIPPSTASYLSLSLIWLCRIIWSLGGICLEDDRKIQMDDKVTGQQVPSGFRSRCCCPGTRRQHNTSRDAARQIFGRGGKAFWCLAGHGQDSWREFQERNDRVWTKLMDLIVHHKTTLLN